MIKLSNILLILLILTPGLSAAESKLPSVFNEVFKVHKALVDETAGKLDVKELENLLSEKGADEKESSVYKKTLPLVKKLGKETDLGIKREIFSNISETLSSLIATKNKSGAGVFFCPMVKKKWIAKGDEIANPYDREMRGCGERIK